MRKLRKQQGITIVEFTLVASTLLLLVFAILEIGYFTFNLQALNDLTRRAARIATVCQVDDGEVIRSLAMSEYVPSGFTTANLAIDYLGADGKSVPNIFADDAPIHYVKAEVVNYNYGFSGILNFLGDNGVISVPAFETVLVAESLGVGRTDPSTGDDVYIDCK
ncbi:TadE/TadG family type IV pilus assembly protein [Vibrio diazotrophicus]|uniref:TadE/TadG family type IV pilus assembly protein n=1 Tax=Vibrio diazotrophicus TaxID=685 RepID=UPI000C9E9E68|nr:TadE family protein [Vibrio diazotrophicus]PNH96873.1 pilus assembly protein CpaE [Vibrio diazotrophicus]